MRYLLTLWRLRVDLVFRTEVVMRGKLDSNSGSKLNLNTSSPDSTEIFKWRNIKSSDAFNFLHPIMFTLISYLQFCAISDKAAFVIAVLPISSTSNKTSSLVKLITPSSLTLEQPSRHTFLNSLQWVKAVTPASVIFLHSDKDKISKFLCPPHSVCVRLMSAISVIFSHPSR